MGHYKSNLRDLEFNLFEVFNRQEILGTGPYAEVDQGTAREILHEVGRLAENELAESLLDSDRNPPVFDPATSSVKLPASFVKSYKTYVDAEWWRLDVPRELGGTVVPPSLRWAVAELVLGSNPAVHMYSAGFAFSKVLYGLGTEDQKKMARHMVDNKWGGTMVLTEPDAGSDVGAGRTKAVQQADGTWHITGVKRFITSGDADFYDNVVHLVLARPEGAGAGTKGLSLFVVPKYHVDLETGDLGEHNGVYVTNLEHKMGLKVSTTCELTFGDREPAVGTLVGDVHDGIAQMFRIIEFARMMVGTKAIATLSTGYLNALDYAKERVQGADLTRMTDKAAPRVTITHHPDIRRSLISVSRFVSSLWSGASPVVCPCIAVIGVGPTACNRVGQTTGGAAHDERRGNRGSSMPRGARPGRQLGSRRSGSWFDHLASTAGGDRRIPFLPCGHDREQLAQQRGSNGCVGLPTVELVLVAAGQVRELSRIDRVGLLGPPNRPPGSRAQSRPALPGQLGAPGVGAAALLPWSQARVFDHGAGAGETGQVAGLGQDSGATKSGQANDRADQLGQL